MRRNVPSLDSSIRSALAFPCIYNVSGLGSGYYLIAVANGKLEKAVALLCAMGTAPMCSGRAWTWRCWLSIGRKDDALHLAHALLDENPISIEAAEPIG